MFPKKLLLAIFGVFLKWKMETMFHEGGGEGRRLMENALSFLFFLIPSLISLILHHFIECNKCGHIVYGVSRQLMGLLA